MATPRSTPHRLDRRRLVTGVAWAAPIAAVATAAPAVAASPQPGLQGRVTLTRNCSGGRATIQADSAGNYPERGLWAEGVRENTSVTGATVVLYLPSSVFPTSTTWTRNTSDTVWSVFQSTTAVPQKRGFNAWSSTYSGTWQYRATERIKFATGVLNQTTSRGTACPSSLQAYALRIVTIDGKQYSFERGPVTLQ